MALDLLTLESLAEGSEVIESEDDRPPGSDMPSCNIQQEKPLFMRNKKLLVDHKQYSGKEKGQLSPLKSDSEIQEDGFFRSSRIT